MAGIQKVIPIICCISFASAPKLYAGSSWLSVVTNRRNGNEPDRIVANRYLRVRWNRSVRLFVLVRAGLQQAEIGKFRRVPDAVFYLVQHCRGKRGSVVAYC